MARDQREYAAAYRAAHREELAEASRQYRSEHPEEDRSRHAAYYAANSEKIREKRRQRYAALDPAARQALHETSREDSRVRRVRDQARHAANPLKRKWKSINRTAKLRGCSGQISFSEFLVMVEATGGVCPACHELFGTGRAMMSFDHVLAISLGGEHSAANGQLLCWSCNDHKGNRVIWYETT